MREGWSKRSLGDVATIYNGNSINAEEKKKKYLGQTQGLPFIATKDVGNDGVIDYENGVRIPNYTDFKIAHPDSVFVCAEGGSAGKKVAFIEQKVCFGNKLFALQPKKALLNGRYLYYFVQSQAFKEQFKQLITGIIGGVSSKKFKEIPIILSPLPEQQRIVDILDREFAKINALKANAEKSLQAAKDLFQETLHRYYSGKNALLGDVLNLRRGHDLTHSEMKDGSIPVAGSGGIIGYHSIATPISPCIAVGRSGSVGKVFVYETCWAHNTILYVDDFKGNNPYYLVYLLKSLNLTSYGGGSAVPTLNRNVLHPLPVGYTSNKKEQATIVACLDNLNDKCQTLQDNYQKTLALCDDLKQSLLRKAFNGEL